MLLQPAQIEFHLSLMRGLEGLEFEFDRNEAAEDAMIE
jgi:hypothetical protein